MIWVQFTSYWSIVSIVKLNLIAIYGRKNYPFPKSLLHPCYSCSIKVGGVRVTRLKSGNNESAKIVTSETSSSDSKMSDLDFLPELFSTIFWAPASSKEFTLALLLSRLPSISSAEMDFESGEIWKIKHHSKKWTPITWAQEIKKPSIRLSTH